MKREPLTQYEPPTYPDRAEGEPAVHRFVPNRWRKNGTVAGAVALLFFPLSGTNTSAQAEEAQKAAAAGTDDRKSKKPPLKLSAVFEHGEGRGAFGCVAVAPPAFLTEADARQVILEEFARVGVSFQLDTKEHPTLKERTVVRSYEELPDGGVHPVQKVFEGPFILDGYDPKHRIGFEYVSEDDYFNFGGRESASTVQFYDFKALAKDLATQSEKDPSMNVAFFYDPMGGSRGHGEGGETNLREQVRDFIDWLKAHNVLEEKK